jgi:hypothetical protein
MTNPYQPPSLTQDSSPPPVPTKKSMGDNAGMRLLLPVGRSGWAIAAGYAGLFGLLIAPAPLALILGVIAVKSIKKSKGTGKPKHGMGRAVFALIVGILGSLILAYLVIGSL